MAAALTLCIAAAGCVRAAPEGAAAGGPLTVVRPAAPFGYWEGAAARKQAEADCAARGSVLRTSLRDRFAAGAWVFAEGCA
ncbi:MAG: hypothetical protein RIT14_1623 [Pseudomonadota bacterium]|jgi:hypothetical protein